jgi:hypothetical protein
MKMWWMFTLGLAATAASALAAAGDDVPVKDPNGKTLAVVVLCNDCEGGAAKKGCYDGAENGFRKGKACGPCLMKANPVRILEHPYDLHVTGILKDPKGEPIKDRFVKLFMPNGWGHRTKTLDKGQFHLMLGATSERKSSQPLTVDIGSHVDVQNGEKDQYFAMYMLPVDYKGCDAAAAAPDVKK